MALDEDEQFYAFVSGERASELGAPATTALQIERIATSRGWPVGEVIAHEPDLLAQFQVSRETLREAIRIIENRGAMRMRRGRAGGLSVVRPRIERVAAAFAAFLGATGISQGQFERAARALDLLLIWKIARLRDPLPPPCAGGETVRQWLARMSGESLLGVYVLALEHLSPVKCTAKARTDITAALLTAVSQNAEDAASALLRSMPISFVAESGQHSANARAQNLAIRIMKRGTGQRSTALGNETSLQNEYETSRTTIRQAIRILQDLDMLSVRRGRGGGYTLKSPSPIGMIRQMFPLLASEQRSPSELVEMMWDLNTVNLQQAAEQLFAPGKRSGLFAQCDRLERLLEENQEPERFVLLQQSLAEIARNPAVDTLAKCIVSYQVRIGGPPGAMPSQEHFLMRERAIVSALRQRDAPKARQALRLLQGEMSASR